MSRTILIAAATLVLGLVAGFFLGRFTLERSWSQPYVLLSQSDISEGKGANPAPKPGARVLKPMPLARSRQVMNELTKTDPLVMTVGAVGNGDHGAELHLTLEHRDGKLRCQIASYSGIAYGFDAWGKPAKLNQKGEHFVAFSGEKLELQVGEKHLHSAELKDIDNASLAVAQVDEVICANGERWQRNVAN